MTQATGGAHVARQPYPLRLEADLDPVLARWRWLVKWLLLLPHYVVLLVLWLGYAVTTIVAMVAILVTSRYPRRLFDVNVAILRYTWRVAYYGYSGLGTDRYPPFTLAERPDYPARLLVDRPERLSRGLVLVKTWLLALPHYVVVSFMVGGGWGHGGLALALVVVAGVVLTFRGAYPPAIFDLVVGLERWAYRVVVYASLMTDEYPPFRLDMGGREPVEHRDEHPLRRRA